MKQLKTYITGITAVAVLVFFPQILAAGEFSKPIPLVGGQTVVGNLLPMVNLSFFKHPKTPKGNFSGDSCFNIDGYKPVCVNDILAVPGDMNSAAAPDVFTIVNRPVIIDDPMLDYLPKDPADLQFTPNGVARGPIDVTAAFAGGSNLNVKIRGTLSEPPTGTENANLHDREVLMMDIRKAGSLQEFMDLWGDIAPGNPLYDLLEKDLICSAAPSDSGPYSSATYPAAVVAYDEGVVEHTFRWNVKWSVREGVAPNETEVEYKIGPLGMPGSGARSESEWFSPGIVDIGSGLVAISYDPLNVQERYCVSGVPADVKVPRCDKPEVSDEPFVGALTFFGKKGGENPRYLFTGYTDFAAQGIVATAASQEEFNEKIKYLAFPESLSGLIPRTFMAYTNPVAISKINLGGAAGGDTDIAVVYQSTLGDLGLIGDVAAKNCVTDLRGRCAVMDNGEYLISGDSLGTCGNGATCATADFKSLKGNYADRFVDGVISPVLFWKQTKKWDLNSTDYSNRNPSDFMRPDVSAYIEYGALDSFTITDKAPAKQYLAVPAKDILYLIDPINGERLWQKGLFDIVTNKYVSEAKKTTIVLPEAKKLTAPEGFYLYGVRGDYLDASDPCADIILTWRGKFTRFAEGAKYIFSDKADGEGKRCSNIITVMKRTFTPATKRCEFEARADKSFVSSGEPVVEKQICSVTTGDFNGDGQVDMAFGDLVAKNLPEAPESCASFAYVLPGPDFVLMNAKPIRMGFSTGSVTDGKCDRAGISKIVSDTVDSGVPSIAAISGEPMAYGDMEACPDSANLANDPTIMSPYEIYESIHQAVNAVNGDMSPPFSRPVEPLKAYSSQRCSSQSPKLCNGIDGINLPFYQKGVDGCCEEWAVCSDKCKKILSCPEQNGGKMCEQLKNFCDARAATGSQPTDPVSSGCSLSQPDDSGTRSITCVGEDGNGNATSSIYLSNMLHMPKAHFPQDVRELTAVVWKEPTGGTQTPPIPGVPPPFTPPSTPPVAPPPPGATEPVAKGATAPFARECHCMGFGSVREMEQYNALNQEIRDLVPGMKDDLFCPTWQPFLCGLLTYNTSYPGKDTATLSLSYSGTPIPGDVSNTMPSTIVQLSGSPFRDYAADYSKGIKVPADILIPAPLIITPLDLPAGTAGKDLKTGQIIRPSLDSAIAEMPVLAGAELMSVAIPDTSVLPLSTGGAIVNNTFESRAIPVSSLQTFSLSFKDGTPTLTASADPNLADLPGSTAFMVKGMIPPGNSERNIEDRNMDLDVLKDTIKKCVAEKGVKSAIECDLPWGDNLTYKFLLVQSMYSPKAVTAPAATEVKTVFGILGGAPNTMGSGGGCNCKSSIVNTAPVAGTILVQFVMFLVALAGIGVVRRRGSGERGKVRSL